MSFISDTISTCFTSPRPTFPFPGFSPTFTIPYSSFLIACLPPLNIALLRMNISDHLDRFHRPDSRRSSPHTQTPLNGHLRQPTKCWHPCRATHRLSMSDICPPHSTTRKCNIRVILDIPSLNLTFHLPARSTIPQLSPKPSRQYQRSSNSNLTHRNPRPKHRAPTSTMVH